MLKGALHSVPKSLATWLGNFQKMCWECEQAGNTMVDELLTFTMDKFEDYEQNLQLKQITNPNFQPITPIPMAGKPPNDPMQDFNKGICPDPSSFPMMKNIEQWDGNWWAVMAVEKEKVCRRTMQKMYEDHLTLILWKMREVSSLRPMPYYNISCPQNMTAENGEGHPRISLYTGVNNSISIALCVARQEL